MAGPIPGEPLAAQSQRIPLASPGTSAQGTSATAFPWVAHKLIVTVTTAASTFTVTMVDGTTVSLGSLAVGVYVFDIQCTQYTAGTPANVNVAAFTHL